jgi:pimeloyl-ACP methyl ester carboxylesterase
VPATHASCCEAKGRGGEEPTAVDGDREAEPTGGAARAPLIGVGMPVGRPALADRPLPEQSRARYPDGEGYVDRDGRRLFYELYGGGAKTVFLVPTWSLFHSRHWRLQIPDLARRARVLVLDGLGNGRSDRPRDPRRYGAAEMARDCLAAMDATATGEALVVSLSRGAHYALELGRLAPQRVLGAAFVAPFFPYTPSHWTLMLRRPLRSSFERPAPLYRWWMRMNAVHWRRDYPAFARWYVSRGFSEPHSTKGIEDGVGWALETDPEILIATAAEVEGDRAALRALARGIDCPVLVIHGDRDRISPPRDGRALARLAGGRFAPIAGAGHFPHLRKPVAVNLALREFIESVLGAGGMSSPAPDAWLSGR